jgi:hypothetical protein
MEAKRERRREKDRRFILFRGLILWIGKSFNWQFYDIDEKKRSADFSETSKKRHWAGPAGSEEH